MNESEIKEEVNKLIRLIEDKFSPNEYSNFHFVSAKNFAKHIFKNNKHNKSKLYQINLFRHQKLLLEYLSIIANDRFCLEDSHTLFKDYISKIGEFMGQHHGFSYAGGKIQYLKYLVFASIGAVLDLIRWIVFSELEYWFTIIFLVFAIIRTLIKHKKNKLFGPGY